MSGMRRFSLERGPIARAEAKLVFIERKQWARTVEISQVACRSNGFLPVTCLLGRRQLRLMTR